MITKTKAVLKFLRHKFLFEYLLCLWNFNLFDIIVINLSIML